MLEGYGSRVFVCYRTTTYLVYVSKVRCYDIITQHFVGNTDMYCVEFA